MNAPASLSAYDVLDLAFVVVCLGINLAVLYLMFININRLWDVRGSFDFYFHFLGRSVGWQIIAAIVYSFLYAMI